MKDEGNGRQGLPCYFHCGETNKKDSHNIQDALILGTKRIGHGLQIQIFPWMVELCKKLDVCFEICPISNMVLNYVGDLRQHPASYMMQKGLQISISSDDPGLFGYDGVTLDYVYAMGAWRLSIMDLKKLSLNGIRYASISDDIKQKIIKEQFEPRWREWI